MFRIYWVSIFLFIGQCVFGQSNPFDLKFRPAQSRPSIDTTKSRDVEFPSAPIDIKETIDPAIIDTVDAFTPSTSNVQGDANNPFEIEAEESTPSVKEEPIAESDITPAVSQTGEKRRPSKGIQIFFLLISLLFLIFIVNVERSFVRDLWKVISNENYSSLHLRNQRNTMRQILLLMGYFVFIIQAGLFFYRTLVLFNYQGTLLDNIWACMLMVLIVYLTRHAVIAYLKWLFNNEKEMNLFSFDISIFNIMVGLVLLPINVLMNFGPESLAKPLIIMGLIVVVLAYLMRQLRWMLTARQLITNSLFLFFVYLCAVEILPLWAISQYFW